MALRLPAMRLAARGAPRGAACGRSRRLVAGGWWLAACCRRPTSGCPHMCLMSQGCKGRSPGSRFGSYRRCVVTARPIARRDVGGTLKRGELHAGCVVPAWRVSGQVWSQIVVNARKNRGKAMEEPWNSRGQTLGKPRTNRGQTAGKFVGEPRTIRTPFARKSIELIVKDKARPSCG